MHDDHRKICKGCQGHPELHPGPLVSDLGWRWGSVCGVLLGSWWVPDVRGEFQDVRFPDWVALVSDLGAWKFLTGLATV